MTDVRKGKEGSLGARPPAREKRGGERLQGRYCSVRLSQFSRGISGGKQIIKFANASDRDRI